MIRCFTDAAPNGRPLRLDEPFETAVDRTLGEAMRSRPGFWQEVMRALVNVAWYQAAQPYGATFTPRGAADLIAAVIGKGSYLTYFTGGERGAEVTDEIATALGREFWLWRVVPA
jgi:hypothetical protein